MLANECDDPKIILRYQTLKGGVLTTQFLADKAEPIVEELQQLPVDAVDLPAEGA